MYRGTVRKELGVNDGVKVVKDGWVPREWSRRRVRWETKHELTIMLCTSAPHPCPQSRAPHAPAAAAAQRVGST